MNFNPVFYLIKNIKTQKLKGHSGMNLRFSVFQYRPQVAKTGNTRE